MGIVYLFLGLGLVAGIFWTLTQIATRQRRLQDELSRLERLAAEVALNSDAILDRVDERTERLQALLAQVEAAAAAFSEATARTAEAALAQEALRADLEQVSPPTAQESAPPPRKRGRTRKQEAAPAPPPPAGETTGTAQAPPPASMERYQALRTRVEELSNQGLDAGTVAQLVGVPRGEVQLILNLRTNKVTV